MLFSQRHRRQGLTLGELLVAIAGLVIIGSLLYLRFAPANQVDSIHHTVK